ATIAAERDRFGEFELRPGVQADDLLPFELEAHAHRFPVRPRHDLEDLRVLEHRYVEPHGLLGLIVEPEEWGDLLHRSSPNADSRGARRSDRGSGCSRRAP